MPLFSVLFACEVEQSSISKNTGNNVDSTKTDDSDSLITGEPFLYEPHLIPGDSVLPPEVVPAGTPKIEEAYLNVKRVSLPEITLVSPNPTKKTPGSGGVPLPEEIELVGDTNRNTYSKPTPALSPSFKDAATYNIQYIDVDQGLSSSYIMCIEEDRRGNLWFSTWQMGVCMYNGQSFTHFGNDEGLGSNYIWSICEDANGHIWFGSDGNGLSIYDGDHFTSYNAESGLPHTVIKDIIMDDDENIWLGTLGGGLIKFEDDRVLSYTTKQGLPSNTINNMALGKDGDIIIGSDLGITIFDGHSFTTYTEADGLHHNDVQAVYEDSEENIWIGGPKGVSQFDGYSFFTFTEEQGLSSNLIEEILEDSYGNMWFATADGGVTMYDRNNFTHITTEQGLSNNSIYSLHEDSHGNIWFGSYGAGANKYNERSFQNFTENSGLPTSIIRNIIEDREGSLWFVHSLGATKYKDGLFVHYNSQNGLSDNFVRDAIQDSRGNIWFATDAGGVTKYDGSSFYQYGPEQGVYGTQVLTIFEDSDSNIYFGTVMEGVFMISPDKEIHQFKFENELTLNTVRAISEDHEGNIWFGTNGGGAYKYDGQNMTIYSSNEGIDSPTILSFLPTEEEELWVGSEHGGVYLFDYEKDTMKSFAKNELSNNIIWSMAEDYDGNIWIGTEKGLNMISFNDSTRSDYMVTTYGKLDGLKGIDFFPNSVCLDNQSRFWWGTGKALMMLDLNKYEQISKPPRVAITDVELHQSFVDYRKLKDTLESGKNMFIEGDSHYSLEDVEFDDVIPFTNTPEELELPYSLNHVTFHFTAIDWSAPHKLRYQYKLEGLQDEWSPVLEDNKAVYNNIPEGTYTFQVRAIGEAQVWSDIVKYPLVVHPPWYKTTLAYIGYVLGGIILIISIIYLRTRKLIEQRKKLEQTVQERTLEVVQQKEIVEVKNKEITDSITYAKRIQEAILPSGVHFKQVLSDSFILYKPKDIVAGDFYWLEHSHDKILVAVADCTGHGVPGAMVSVVCNNALNRTVREFGLSQPSDILNKVRDLVIEAFESGEKGIKDGMDIALLSYNTKTKEVEYSGANNSLYLIRNGEIITYEADKQPIGKYAVNKDFTNHKVNIQTGDTLYIYTDGYMDQFGGPKGKKFKYTPFVEMLVKIQDKSMAVQKEFIDEVFENWKGNYEQIDDVCVIGVRI